MRGAWSTGGNLATARQRLAGAGTQTAGLSFGGLTDDSTAVTEEYNGAAWSGGGDLATARRTLAGAGTQTAGLSFGGYTDSSSAVTEEYDGAAWSSGGDLATARYYIAGAGTQTAGLSFGGSTGSNSVVTEEYDGAAWSSGGDLATARYYLAGAGTQTAGLAFGGYLGIRSAVTEEYDGAAWSSGGNLATARYGLAGAGTQTAGLSFGGFSGINNAIVTEEYDGAAWSGGGNLATARQGLAGAGTQAAGLAFGGYTSSISAVTEEYNLLLWLHLANVENVKLLIDDTDVSDYVDMASLSIKDTGGSEIETVSFDMQTHPDLTTLEWKECEVIATLDDASEVTLFAGYITRPGASFGGATSAVLSVRAEGWKTLLSRSKPIAGYWSNATAQTIVEGLLTNAEISGFTVDAPSTPTLVTWKISFDENVAQNISRLCKERGWVWRVTWEKEIVIGAQTSDMAPWGIAEASLVNYTTLFPVEDAVTEKDASQIVNALVIKGGVTVSDTQVEDFVGDGETVTFFVDYRPIYEVVSIKVDGVFMTWGTMGYHSCLERQALVHFDGGYVRFCAAPALAADIEISYVYRFNYTYTANDTDSQTAIGMVLWGLVEANWITDDETAAIYAAAVFDNQASAPKRLTCDLRRMGVRAGQTIPCRFPELGVGATETSENLLIESIGVSFSRGRQLIQSLRLGPANEHVLSVIEAGLRSPLSAPTTSGSVYFQGTAGGFQVGYNSLLRDTGTDATSAGLAPDDYPFYAGAIYTSRAAAPFRVTPAGALTASSGVVGGWTLGAASLTGGNATLHNTGYLLLGTGNSIVRLDAAHATHRIWAGHATAADAPFNVATDGYLQSTYGSIGGWALDQEKFYAGNVVLHSAGYLTLGTSNDIARLDASDATYRLWAGHATAASAPFSVSKAGALVATAATITGAITASSGSITGFLTLGASGGIYQGSGTSGSPTTGLKIWNDGGTGRIAGYNGSTVQWYANTDGKLYAGAGKVLLDANGVAVQAYETTLGSAATNRYRMVDTSNGELSWIAGVYDAGNNSMYVSADNASRNNFIYINTIAPTDKTASTSIVAAYETDTNKAQVQAASNSTYGIVNVLSDYLVVDGELGTQGGAQLTVYGETWLDQSNSSGAVPVLLLDQADVSEEMIEFVSAAGTGNAIEAVGSKTLATTHFIKVTINGDTRYIPAGTIA